MKDKKTQCNDCSTIFTGDGVDDMCPSCEGKLHEIINNSKCECEHPVIESNMTVEYCRKCYRLMSKPSPSTVGSELKENNLPIGEQINVLADKIRRAKKKCYTLPSTNKVTTPAPLNTKIANRYVEKEILYTFESKIYELMSNLNIKKIPVDIVDLIELKALLVKEGK
jgi:Zn finger protein HypA/HybF involved in hydrogenase expression